ncbi:hypothetical protein Ahy_B10g104245 [Arachis hypogaea]|uniref:Uncharacterized protein n=1 Tax=Arachis hypogaea TaxID=3818 RepID=A0A444X515_ARAHY|nr:hypothetical protein Ahy_B10g104245 [Arachis hypogaea]
MATMGITSSMNRLRGGSQSTEKRSVGGSASVGRNRSKKAYHPKCKCGSYAILSRSRTIKNLNRIKLSYCDFFTSFDTIFNHLVDDAVEDGGLEDRVNQLEKLRKEVKFYCQQGAYEQILEFFSDAIFGKYFSNENEQGKGLGLGFYIVLEKVSTTMGRDTENDEENERKGDSPSKEEEEKDGEGDNGERSRHCCFLHL